MKRKIVQLAATLSDNYCPLFAAVDNEGNAWYHFRDPAYGSMEWLPLPRLPQGKIDREEY